MVKKTFFYNQITKINHEIVQNLYFFSNYLAI